MNNLKIDKETMKKIEELKMLPVLEDMLCTPSLINLDREDLEHFFDGKKLFAVMDNQISKGQEPNIILVDQPLETTAGILYFYVPSSKTIDDVKEVIIKIRKRLGDIDIVYGLSINDELQDMRVAGFFATK